MIPPHGRINCSKCFNTECEWDKNNIEAEGYMLENNPCAWGSSNPQILILGFSKGYNQTRNILESNLNDIPFRKMRNRLDSALKRVGVLKEFESVNQKINESETEFAFGSLIRCSISKFNPKKNKYEKTGNNILSSTFKNKFAGQIAHNCIEKYLTDLPEKTKLIILLGNDDKYMEYLEELLTKFYPDINRINQVAYKVKDKTFVHIAHPSGQNGHFGSWLNGIQGAQANKRDLAIQAIQQSGLNRQDILFF